MKTLDSNTVQNYLGSLAQNDEAQRKMIQALTELLQEAVDHVENPGEFDIGDDPAWYDEAKKLLEIQKKVVPVQMPVQPTSPAFTPEQNVQLNEVEAGFGGELSEEELAKMFNSGPVKATPKKKKLKQMSQEEINRMPVNELQKLVIEAEEDEYRQDNSSDIYKVKGRIQNLAVGISGGNLTAVGEMMVNSFVHVVKDLYDFADTLQDSKERAKLYERIKKHESMPGTLIAAAAGGVRVKK